jgi:hypothetical protein
MTIRASNCLAAITGILGFFAMGSAQADTRLGATLNALAPTEKIVIKAGFEHESPCYRPRYHKPRWHHRERCRHFKHRRHRYHRAHRHHYPRRPYYGHNYEIYTYRKPYSIGPRLDVQMVYGWYRGYYYPYPYYRGIGY